jgi:hypothetical protein
MLPGFINADILVLAGDILSLRRSAFHANLDTRRLDTQCRGRSAAAGRRKGARQQIAPGNAAGSSGGSEMGLKLRRRGACHYTENQHGDLVSEREIARALIQRWFEFFQASTLAQRSSMRALRDSRQFVALKEAPRTL